MSTSKVVPIAESQQTEDIRTGRTGLLITRDILRTSALSSESQVKVMQNHFPFKCNCVKVFLLDQTKNGNLGVATQTRLAIMST